jgi:putative transposase
VPFRRLERALLRFRRMRNLQMFASVHAFVTNHFNQKRSLSSRPLFKANRAAYYCSDRTLFTLFFLGGRNRMIFTSIVGRSGPIF